MMITIAHNQRQMRLCLNFFSYSSPLEALQTPLLQEVSFVTKRVC